MARRWFNLIRSTLQRLQHFFVSRYQKLQPTPLEVGVALMIIMFPTGVWLNQKTDSTSQYLAGYANGFFMLGLGLVLAYLYIDRFNERAQRQQYREVNGVLVEAVNAAATALVVHLFGVLYKTPNEALEDAGVKLTFAFAKYSCEHFDADRSAELRRFKGRFDVGLRESRRYLEYQQRVDASYIIFTEQETAKVVTACQPLFERISTGVTRLLSARLKTRVIEDLLVIENESTNYFITFVRHHTMLQDEEPSTHKAELSLDMWIELQRIFDYAFKSILVLDDLLEGTKYRERQRRGEYVHWTTTAGERRMD